MNEGLKQYIEEYGGKHGGLLYFRDQVEGGQQRVLPFELLMPGDQFTRENMRGVQAACRESGTDKVIVRTSEQADWAGMVDTMPTVVCEKGWAGLGWGIKRVIEKVRQQCHDPGILEYARREGNGYDPNRVTISVAPYVRPTRSTPQMVVTEHPNEKGTNLVDLAWPDAPGSSHFDHSSFDYVDGNNLSYDWNEDVSEALAQSALKLQRWATEAGVLSGNEAFQFEGGLIPGGRAKLFQIRHLAERRVANFQLDQNAAGTRRRFGITPEEGVVLRVARVGERKKFRDFEVQNPGVNYLLGVERTTEPLKITDQPTSMRAYMGDRAALSHQNTRFVQMSLEDPNGVSAIAVGIGNISNLPKTVRIISDGVRQRIERG